MESYCCGGVDTFVINLINNWPNAVDEFILLSNGHDGLRVIKDSIHRSCLINQHQLKIFTSFFIKGEGRKLIDEIRLAALKIFSFIVRYMYLIYNIVALKGLLLRNNPDRLIVISGGYPGGDSARAASIAWGLYSKKPHCMYVFFGLVSKPGWHIKLQESLIDILLAGLTSKFITDSMATAKTMSRRNFIYKINNKVGFIHNGIEVSERQQKHQSSIKTELGIPFSSKVCLMLGAYTYHKTYDKGHYFLMQVFKKVVAKIPSAHLLICGSGTTTEIDRVRRFVSEFKLQEHVHLFGFRKDVPSLLRQADLLLVASQAFESFGFTSIEAMSLGVPVIATKIGGIPEVVVDGQGGYCVDKNDVNAYADRVIQLLQDDNLREEQGGRARQRYQDYFTSERMAKEYARIIV